MTQVEKLLKKKDIIEALSIEKSTLDRWMASGFFPPPDVRRFTTANKKNFFVRWKASTLSKFISEMEQEKDDAQ
ncbi:hypothetical protein GS537_04435 [Saccharibacter sp. EH60]|nr:hypothetical protein [Saccharibacter sp. EH70]MXV65474.1 hypothetical protein [Saccharibacter sp. EH60]